MRSLAVLSVTVFALGACEPEPTFDPTERCGDWTHTVTSTSSGRTEFDLLLVVSGVGIDDLAREEQSDRLARGVRAIVTGDYDEDGMPDVRTYSSVRVGVVSADVGDDGAGVAGCTPIGGDGRFVSCVGATDHVLDVGNVDTALDAVRCAIESAMRTTCPRVRPLDAARLALLPASSTAVPGHVPHGDREHLSFTDRPDDDLGVLVLAAQDDCSGGEARALLDEASCVRASDLVEPDAVREELLGVRRWLHRVVIAGYPEPPRDTSELASIVPHVLGDGSIEPGCSTTLSASPAPRLAGFAGEWGSAASICSGDRSWLGTFAGVFPSISIPIGCLPRAVPRDASGLVDCRVELGLPPRAHRDAVPSCASIGATPIDGTDIDDEVCALRQVGSVGSFEEDVLSFAYDDGAEAHARCGAAFSGGQVRVSSFDVLDPETTITITCRGGTISDAGVPRCPW